MTDEKKRDSKPDLSDERGATIADEEHAPENEGGAEDPKSQRDGPAGDGPAGDGAAAANGSDGAGDTADTADTADTTDGGDDDAREESPQEAAAKALAKALESLEAAGVHASQEVLEDSDGGSGPGQLVRAFETTPKNLFVLPLLRAVAFPGLMMPVQLGTNRVQQIVQRSTEGGGFVVLLTRRGGSDDAVEGGDEEGASVTMAADEAPPDPASFFEVGVVAKILRTFHLPDGSQAAMLQGLRRVRVSKVVRRTPFLIVQTEDMHDIPANPERSEAQVHAVRSLLKQIVDRSPQFGDEFTAAAFNIDDAGHVADFCASYLFRKVHKRQDILEIQDVGARLDAVAHELTRELGVLELSAKIQQEIRDKIEKAQREYFLREQLKIIRRELGEEMDAREAELARLRKSVDEAGLSPAALEKAKEELERLAVTPVESPEHSVVRNHLDWLVSLPWAKVSKDRKDITVAATVLDEDHYGLAEVKERVLEFLAVRKLREGSAGPILCLAGPPGVGKTSLAMSIARAMQRDFFRFSLGGMRDEAEIKGHRRTYVGAMPGRILQGLKQAGTKNPVFVLDEIDKLGSDYRGDPSSAMLEVLDPAQNHNFLDHYLDVPFDLSKVFFVATANVLSNIPAPLRDRMEVIEIPGYLTSEKVEIALRHLLPKQREAHGLKVADLKIAKSTMRAIVEGWTREAGVRGLEKQISKICRRVALQLAKRRKRKTASVAVQSLPDLLGQPRFGTQRLRRIKQPGVCQGLAWTPVGGEVLLIEAAMWPGKGSIQVTGSLGDVMRESVRIAHSYLLSRTKSLGLDTAMLEKQDLHVHFPSGAIPKDGPSAGITIASALLSLWLGKRCPHDIAMTGELTLAGNVLPIGGVREKVLAAKREKLTRIVLPLENQADVEEIDAELVDGLDFVFVATFDDVLAALGFESR